MRVKTHGQNGDRLAEVKQMRRTNIMTEPSETGNIVEQNSRIELHLRSQRFDIGDGLGR